MNREIRFFQSLHLKTETLWNALKEAGLELPAEMSEDASRVICDIRGAWEKVPLLRELGVPGYAIEEDESGRDPQQIVIELPETLEDGREFEFSEDESTLRNELVELFKSEKAA